MSARTVDLLAAKDAAALRAFLAQDAPHNLYLLGILEEFGISPGAGRAFWARRAGADLTAALFVGGNGGLVVPSSSDPTEISAVADHVSTHGLPRMGSALGEKNAVDAVMRYLCPEKPRISRTYKLYAVSADDLGPFTNPTLRLAVEKDLPELVQLSAAAVHEQWERDPLTADAEGFKARVAQKVRAKRTYVLEGEGKRLVFKVDVGSRCDHGAELEGMYILPDERHMDHATLSLGQISRHLLSSLPRLTLRVDERDTALATAARKVGYMPGKLGRMVVRE